MARIVVSRCCSVAESSNADKGTRNLRIKSAIDSRRAQFLQVILIMLAGALSGRTVAAWAQTVVTGAAAQNLGVVPVGTTGNPVTIGYTVSGYSGTSYMPVFKMAFGMDTVIAAPSCTGGVSPQTCSVQVTLKPTFPGLIKDAVKVSDPTTGALLAETLVYGTGTGPLGVFQPGTASVLNVGTPGGVSLTGPSGIAVDGAGNGYISETSDNRILEVPPGGPATVLNVGMVLNSPGGVAVDGAGNVYIADTLNNRIVKVPPGGPGSVLNVVTPGGESLNSAAGVAVDGAGNVFIADTGNGRVVEVTTAGVASVLNVGSPGGLPLGTPFGLAVDGTGNVIIADTRPNHRIVRVPPGGPGIVVDVGTPDGVALLSPADVAVDAAGNIYISDNRNSRIVLVPPAGAASVLNTGTPGGMGLHYPSEIALDGSGNLYITDFVNNRVVVLAQAATPPLSFAKTNVGSTSTDSPMTATLVNIGNQALNISALGTSTTGHATSSFNLNGSTTTCTSSSSLAAGATCGLGVQFAPVSVGKLSGSVDITANNLNIVGVQHIALSGDGLGFTTITLMSSVNPQVQGLPVVFTAQVTPTPSNGPVPTGTVSFSEGGTPLGPAASLNAAGIATFTTSSLSIGTHTITASYSGDRNFVGATSPPAMLVVVAPPDFALSSSTPPQIIPPGASASFTIHVPPVGASFTGVVALTASGLPAGASYTFNPATVTPGSRGANSTLTITVPKQSAMFHRSFRTPLVLALLLLPFSVLRRAPGRPSRLLLLFLLTLTSAGVIAGCGSGGYFNQPQRTYIITVTGTSGNLSHSTSVTLTVQ
jgi:sugar lactone lactonase YvrE